MASGTSAIYSRVGCTPTVPEKPDRLAVGSRSLGKRSGGARRVLDSRKATPDLSAAFPVPSRPVRCWCRRPTLAHSTGGGSTGDIVYVNRPPRRCVVRPVRSRSCQSRLRTKPLGTGSQRGGAPSAPHSVAAKRHMATPSITRPEPLTWARRGLEVRPRETRLVAPANSDSGGDGLRLGLQASG